MPYRPTHRQLQYFVAVAATGHFQSAARSCSVSQPTLSTQLKLLEDQLGVALIERGKTTALPTAAGTRLLPMAQNILSNLDDFVEMATLGAENLGGSVRLGVAPTFGPYFMPFFLPQLHSLYPSLEIYIREDRPNLLEADLKSGKIDCIIEPMPASSESFDTVNFCREKLLLGIPGEHPLSNKKSVTIADLKGERLLSLGRGHRLFDHVQRLCETSGAQMREDYEGTSLDALRQMVSIGMGLSLFPGAYIGSEFAHETGVKLVEISDLPLERTIGFAWRKNSMRAEHYKTLCREATRSIDVMDRAEVKSIE